MYEIGKLLDDVVKSRGALRRGGQADKGDYEKVWDAFNRYLTVTHQKRQTLNVHNFCKIGWKIEEHQGKARLRPHFQLAESFMRVFNLEARSHPCIADRYLTSSEEFNLSKAAIRYSQSLTKDNIFMGLRAIVHQIGEAAAHEQVNIDFEVGKLICKDRNVEFVFLAEIYSEEGLEVPEDAVLATDYQPSATYGPPTKDALSLNVQGSSKLSGGSVKANHFGGWEDRDLSPQSPSVTTNEGHPMSTRGSTPSVASSAEGRHMAHVEALGRHIAQMELDAAHVMADKRLWEGHLERCNNLEQKDLEWRRGIARDYAEQLRLQIQQDDEKRVQLRKAHCTEESMHDFPSFKKPQALDADVQAFLNERAIQLKKDLDQQVESKKHMQKVQKVRDRELELVSTEASQWEIQSMRREETSKKALERGALVQAWDQDIRLKAVKKAIDDHHKTPGPKAKLHSLVTKLTGSVIDGPSPLCMDRLGRGPELSPRLQTPGSQSARSEGSSRVSGFSARRKPIGAAASLALSKEKMKAGMRI